LKLNKKLNILICPLGWGLGHAARMIPLARSFTEMGHNVLIAAGEEHLNLFREELPGLKYIPFSGFSPSYSRRLPQYVHLLLKTPALIYHIIREHFILKELVQKYSADLVISDNRFGLWNGRTKCVYVTHMPRIPFPKPFRFLEPIGIRLHRWIIGKYDYCFIPDLPGNLNLSGKLSHGLRLKDNTKYIGILSRFPVTPADAGTNRFTGRHNTLILSGPEPQRSIFRETAVRILRNETIPAIILEGNPGGGNGKPATGNIEAFDHMVSNEMQQAVRSSDTIIARAGYSTIMDLASLHKSAVLVPTPGQTEQEYLASYLESHGWFSRVSQKDLEKGIRLPAVSTQIPHEIAEQSRVLLKKALEDLLK
jgi:UDP-N-acetylglucosamine transferase subunit ALG13